MVVYGFYFMVLKVLFIIFELEVNEVFWVVCVFGKCYSFYNDKIVYSFFVIWRFSEGNEIFVFGNVVFGYSRIF